jgi:hypothetical protein
MEAALVQVLVLVLVLVPVLVPVPVLEPRVVEPRVAVTVTAALTLVELQYPPALTSTPVHHSLLAKEVMAARMM